jgi:hypothetical protein
MKTRSHLVLFAIASTGAMSSLMSCAGPLGREKYETPDYEAVLTEGDFGVRDYSAIVTASAPMTAKTSGQNSAFMTLFRFISGENKKGQKIEMTSPVFSTMQPEANSMSFVVPREVAAAGVPQANDENVVIAERAAGRFAVYRYSGRWTRKREAEAQAALVAWMATKQFEPVAGFEKANYDPPFTPPSLRRNEILVRIRE